MQQPLYEIGAFDVPVNVTVLASIAPSFLVTVLPKALQLFYLTHNTSSAMRFSRDWCCCDVDMISNNHIVVHPPNQLGSQTDFGTTPALPRQHGAALGC